MHTSATPISPPLDAHGLARMAFFQGFPPAMLAQLAPLATEERYPPEKHLLREGEDATRFYVIRDGLVTISSEEDQDATPIQSLGVGEVIGWSWMCSPYIWTFDAVTRSETTVVAFDALRLRELCDAHPEWGYLFMKRLAYVFAMRLKHMREVWRAEHISQTPPH